jgi:SPP1 gp7 family putative phage head morphogenesis protein
MDLRLRRRVSLGKTRVKKVQKRLPAQVIGRGLISAYAAELRDLLDVLRKEMKPLFDELIALVPDIRGDARLDAGEEKRLAQLMTTIRARMSRRLTDKQMAQLARRYATRTSAAQRKQLGRQFKAALGVDLFTADVALKATMTKFVRGNVALIKSIPANVLDDVQRVVQGGIQGGMLRRDLAAEIDRRFTVGRTRANTIARNEISSFHGQLNAERQRGLGITRFIWRSSRDERVRDLHEDYDGQTFSYDDPPSDGLPGEPINCRCYAEPVFEDLL